MIFSDQLNIILLLSLCLCLQDPNSHLLLVCLKFGHAKFVPSCVIEKTYRQFLLDRGMFREQLIDDQILLSSEDRFCQTFHVLKDSS